MLKDVLKKMLKGITLLILFLLIFYLGCEAGFRLKYKIEQWKANRSLEKFNQTIEEMFKKDIYGGKTPEETYNLYREALKNGDIELASKYYWWDQQEKEEERLKNMKKEGKLEEYVNSFPDWSEMKEKEYWDPDGKRYSYNYILKEDKKYYDEFLERWDILTAGEYEGELTFLFNKHANIWKLY